jgi:prophage antirepressor-like protein
MSQLIPFNFNQHAIRVIKDAEGEPWFVAKDVATGLGYANPSEAVKNHCKKAKSLKSLDNSKTLLLLKNNELRSDMQFIPESDVYRLVMRSKLESAEAFQDWLVDEVLPSIRKTGGYQLSGFALPKTFAEALRLAADTQEKLEVAQTLVAQQQHALERKDALILASNEASIKAGEVLIREFVKSNDMVDLGEKKFFKWLHEQKIIFSERNEPYQSYVNAGYFTFKPSDIEINGRYRFTLRVTPRGRVWLAAKYMAYRDNSELSCVLHAPSHGLVLLQQGR